MPGYGNMVDELLYEDDYDQTGYTDIIGAAGGGGPRAVKRQFDNIENLIAGIPVTSIAANSEASINVGVQRPFRARRLLMGGSIGSLRINSIKVSNVDQLINSSPVPAVVFSPDAIGSKLRGDTAQPGVGIDLRITNTSSAAVDAEGAFFGEAAT